MFSLVFVSADSQSQDAPAGTPFQVIGPRQLKADCREYMRQRALLSDVEVLLTDESGPTVWRDMAFYKSCLINVQVYLVQTRL